MHSIIGTGTDVTEKVKMPALRKCSHLSEPHNIKWIFSQMTWKQQQKKPIFQNNLFFEKIWSINIRTLRNLCWMMTAHAYVIKLVVQIFINCFKVGSSTLALVSSCPYEKLWSCLNFSDSFLLSMKSSW